MNKQIPIVGITGLMASGKSFCARAFRELGPFVIYTDIIAKQVQEKNSELMLKIIERFGTYYYLPDGKINKDVAIKLFFSNTEQSKENKKWITDTVGPYVLDKILKTQKSFIDAGLDETYILIESAILFESGLNQICDYVINVKASNAIEKAKERDNISEEEYNNRMESQLPELEKHFDFVIENNYSSNVLKQVETIHNKIIAHIRMLNKPDNQITTTSKDYYECPRCEINSLTEKRMCPCPRGSCEAEIKGEIKTTVEVIYN